MILVVEVSLLSLQAFVRELGDESQAFQSFAVVPALLEQRRFGLGILQSFAQIALLQRDCLSFQLALLGLHRGVLPL